MDSRFNEGIVALYLFLFGGIIWLVVEYWEGFKLVFAILILIIVISIIKLMWNEDEPPE